jgi:hypothetical protein
LWLLAELPPAPSDDQGPYRRLHDRSERHDAAAPGGEMVRL